MPDTTPDDSNSQSIVSTRLNHGLLWTKSYFTIQLDFSKTWRGLGMYRHKRGSGSRTIEIPLPGSSQKSSPSVKQDIGTPRKYQSSPLWPPSPGSWLNSLATPRNPQERDNDFNSSTRQKPIPDATILESSTPLACDPPVPQKSFSGQSDSADQFTSAEGLEPPIDYADESSSSAPAHQNPGKPTPTVEIYDQDGLGIMIPERPPSRPSYSAGPSGKAYESVEKTESRNFKMIDPRARDIVEEQFRQKGRVDKNEEEDYTSARLSPYGVPEFLKSPVLLQRGPLCLSPERSVRRIQLVGEKKEELRMARQEWEELEHVYEELRRDRMGGCYPPSLKEFPDKGFWERKPDVSPGKRMKASQEWNSFFYTPEGTWYRWDAAPWGFRILTSIKPENEELKRLIDKLGLDCVDTEDEPPARRKSSVVLKHRV